MDTLKKILTELKPYVIVVGSYARGENDENSDIDLYIKRRPQEELDADMYGELEDSYIDKVIEVIEKNDLPWGSNVMGQVYVEDIIPISIEASYLFKIHKDAEIKTINIHGVEMESTIDDKNIKVEDTFDYIEY